MKAKTSGKIKIAMKKQTRQTQDRHEIGKKVYYRDNVQQWKGQRVGRGFLTL